MITRERAKYITRNYKYSYVVKKWTDEDIEFMQYFKEMSIIFPVKVGESPRSTNDMIIDKYVQIRRDKILDKILNGTN